MDCVACGSAAVTERPERTARGYRRFRCRACGQQYNERSGGLLNQTHSPSDVIALVVLWRLRYRLTLRDLTGMFLVRGSLSATRPFGSGRRSSRRCWPTNFASAGTASAAAAAGTGRSMRPTQSRRLDLVVADCCKLGLFRKERPVLGGHPDRAAGVGSYGPKPLLALR